MAAPSILRDEAPPLLHGHKARRMESTPRVGTKWLYERGGTVSYVWSNCFCHRSLDGRGGWLSKFVRWRLPLTDGVCCWLSNQKLNKICQMYEVLCLFFSFTQFNLNLLQYLKINCPNPNLNFAILQFFQLKNSIYYFLSVTCGLSVIITPNRWAFHRASAISEAFFGGQEKQPVVCGHKWIRSTLSDEDLRS